MTDAERERSAIVAHLRKCGRDALVSRRAGRMEAAMAFMVIADGIERGAHLKEDRP